MKNFLLILAALCTAALAACSKDAVESATPDDPRKVSLRIIADAFASETTADAAPVTRVEYADRLGLRWQAADAEKMAVCCLSGGTWSTVATRSIAIGDDLKATFEADVPRSTTQAYFYYPYSSTDNGTKHKFVFDRIVTQPAAGRSENFSLAARTVTDVVEAGWTATPQFKLVGAVVRLIVYSGTATDERVLSVQLKANAELASTEYEYDLATGSAEALGIRYRDVTVELTEPYSLEGVTSADRAKGIYMPIRPATTKGYSYVVTTDKGTYEFVSSAERTWADGKIYDVKLNLDKGRHKLKYTWDHVASSVMATTERKDLGYFFAYFDDATDHLAETSSVYGMLRFDYGDADFLKAEVDGNNHIFVTCTSETTVKRTATIDVYFDGSTAIYTLENPTEPLFSIAVTQVPADHTYAVNYTWNDVKTALTLNSTARTQLGWYFAYLDGSETRVPDSHEVIGMLKFEYANPADAEWLKSEFVGNNIYVTCTSAATRKRTSTVNVVFNPEAANADKYTLTDAEPLFTFTIAQIPVDYRYYSFHFGFDTAPNTLNLEAVAEAADRELAWASIYAVDGAVKTRFDDNSGIYSTDYIEFYSDVEWLSGSTPNANKLHCLVSANETPSERVGHLYGRMKQSFPGYEEFESDDPLFTVTVTQAGRVHTLAAGIMKYYWNSEWDQGFKDIGRFPTYEMAASGGTTETDSAQFTLDGVALPGTSVEYSYVRIESDAEWLTAAVKENKYAYTCQPNTAGAVRRGVLKVYLDVPAGVEQEFRVVKAASDADYADADRIFTITVTQNAQ